MIAISALFICHYNFVIGISIVGKLCTFKSWAMCDSGPWCHRYFRQKTWFFLPHFIPLISIFWPQFCIIKRINLWIVMVKLICFSHFVFFWNINFRALGLSSKEVLDNYFGLTMHLFLGKGKLRLNCTSVIYGQSFFSKHFRYVFYSIVREGERVVASRKTFHNFHLHFWLVIISPLNVEKSDQEHLTITVAYWSSTIFLFIFVFRKMNNTNN